MIRRTFNKVPNNDHSLNSFRQLISQLNSNKLKHITLARLPSPFFHLLLPSPQSCKRNRLIHYVMISKFGIRSEIHQKETSLGEPKKHTILLGKQKNIYPVQALRKWINYKSRNLIH